MEEDSREITVETEDEDSFEMEEINVASSWADRFIDYWFLWLIIAVGALFLHRKYVAPRVGRWMRERSDKEMEAHLHKNPDLLRAREEAMQRARQRMQEIHNTKAAKMIEIRKAREEKKREEMLHKYTQGGHVLNDDPESRRDRGTYHSDRPEYNPLMGSATGGYRPQRRTCPSGGCG